MQQNTKFYNAIDKLNALVEESKTTSKKLEIVNDNVHIELSQDYDSDNNIKSVDILSEGNRK